MAVKKTISILIASLCIVLILTGIVIKYNQGSEESIRIGAILPMTGGGAQYGEEVRRGIDIALEEINSAGGVNNLPIVLELEDSATDPKTATLAFEKLTAKRDIQCIVTEVSGVVLALAPKANIKKVILFNVGAQNPKIRDAGPYTFSNINDASVESKLLAEFAHNQLGTKRVAVLYAEVAYGEGARSVFSEAFQNMGGVITSEVSFPENAMDFRSQIREVKDSKPEVVYLPGLTKDMAKILKQSYEIGFKPQWLSYAAFEGEDIIKIAGIAAEGVIYSSVSMNYERASQETKGFIDKYREKYSSDPGIYCATGYDATILFSRVVAKVGNDGTKMKDYFLNMSEFIGASGVTKFLPNGAVEKPVIFKTVKNQKFVLYEE